MCSFITQNWKSYTLAVNKAYRIIYVFDYSLTPLSYLMGDINRKRVRAKGIIIYSDILKKILLRDFHEGKIVSLSNK